MELIDNIAQTEDTPNLPKPVLNPGTFYGRIDHREVLKMLLEEIPPVNFAEVIQFEGEELRQKHKIVAIVKQLLTIAEDRNWRLRQRYGHVYVYNGAYWKKCDKDELKGFLSDVAVKMGMHSYEAKFYEFGDKLLKQFLSDSHLREPEINSQVVLINLNNGTYEFTGEKGFVA